MKPALIVLGTAIFPAAALLYASSLLYAANEPPARTTMPAYVPATPVVAGIQCPSGPCLVVATAVSRCMELTDPEHFDECVIKLRLYPDPALKVSAYSGRFNPDVASDEQGHSLVGPPVKLGEVGVATFTQYVPHVEALKRVSRDTALESEIAIHLPAEVGKTMAIVKGQIQLRTLGKLTNVEVPFAPFTSPHTFEFCGTRATIAVPRNLRQPPDAEYSISVDFNHAGMPEAQWNEVSALIDGITMTILDDKGAEWVHNGGSGASSAKSRSVVWQFRPDNFAGLDRAKPGPAATFRLTLPEEFKDVPIPFEFKNLPVP